MNRYKLSKAGINANEGIARLGGDIQIYEYLLNKFPSDPNYSGMCDAIEKQNVKDAFACAHALKGVVGNLSMSRLYNDLIPLVEELRGSRLEKTSELLCAVKRDYEDVIAAITR